MGKSNSTVIGKIIQLSVMKATPLPEDAVALMRILITLPEDTQNIMWHMIVEERKRQDLIDARGSIS